jgi:DNA-binding response OmpR family regulator
LQARIKAVIRRTVALKDVADPVEIVRQGDIAIDPAAHQVMVADKPVNLSPKEFDLLYLLVSNAGKVLTTNEILTRVWGAEFEGQPQVVYVHIRWLREKLGDDSKTNPLIQTVRGVGYKFNTVAK